MFGLQEISMYASHRQVFTPPHRGVLYSQHEPARRNRYKFVTSHFLAIWIVLALVSFSANAFAIPYTCSATATLSGTGSADSQQIDIFQNGNCDNDAIGLFAGTN